MLCCFARRKKTESLRRSTTICYYYGDIPMASSTVGVKFYHVGIGSHDRDNGPRDGGRGQETGHLHFFGDGAPVPACCHPYFHSSIRSNLSKRARLMKLIPPANFSWPQTLPFLSTSFFPHASGVQRLRSVAACGSRVAVGGLLDRRMACSVEKHGGNITENAEMGLVRPDTEDYVSEAIEAVRAGKVIAVPTDTLYGFACDACMMEAVQRIYEIKVRKHTSPLAICVGDVEDIPRFAVTEHLPRGLLDSLLPGPVTVVLKRGESSALEKSLNPGLDSIGVRVPDSNFIRLICRGSESALALTSANLSGQPSSVDIKDFENLWSHCAYIFNGKVLPSGRAGSTVVDLSKLGLYKILRPGSAKEETIATLERYGLAENTKIQDFTSV